MFDFFFLSTPFSGFFHHRAVFLHLILSTTASLSEMTSRVWIFLIEVALLKMRRQLDIIIRAMFMMMMMMMEKSIIQFWILYVRLTFADCLNPSTNVSEKSTGIVSFDRQWVLREPIKVCKFSNVFIVYCISHVDYYLSLSGIQNWKCFSFSMNIEKNWNSESLLINIVVSAEPM